MCNTFIPIATLPTAVLRFAAADPGPGVRRSLSEQTSKRPRTKDFKPIVVLPTAALQFAAAAQETAALCQNRQASTP